MCIFSPLNALEEANAAPPISTAEVITPIQRGLTHLIPQSSLRFARRRGQNRISSPTKSTTAVIHT